MRVVTAVGLLLALRLKLIFWRSALAGAPPERHPEMFRGIAFVRWMLN